MCTVCVHVPVDSGTMSISNNFIMAKSHSMIEKDWRQQEVDTNGTKGKNREGSLNNEAQNRTKKRVVSGYLFCVSQTCIVKRWHTGFSIVSVHLNSFFIT